MNSFNIKKAFIMIIMTCLYHVFYAQSPGSIAVNFDGVAMGRNLNIIYRKELGKLTPYIGWRININSPDFKNAYNKPTRYYKEFYSYNLLQHILGVKAGAEYRMASLSSSSYLFAFADIQVSNGFFRNYYEVKNIDGSSAIPPEIHYQSRYILDHTLGIGIIAKLSQQNMLRMGAGYGFAYHADDNKSYKGIHTSGTTTQNTRGQWWRPEHENYITWQFFIGLDYRLFHKEKSGTPTAPFISHKNGLLHQALGLSYENIHTGYNVNISTSFPIYQNILRLNLGIKYNIGSSLHNDFERLHESYFRKQFRPQTIAERFGILIGLERPFELFPASNITPFVYYDLQLMHSTVLNLVHITDIQTGLTSASNSSIYTSIFPAFSNQFKNRNPVYRHYGPLWAFENYIGLGSRIHLSDKFNLRVKGGIGYNFYAGPENYQDYTISNYPHNSTGLTHYTNVPWKGKKHELSRMFSIGLEYKM